MKICKNCGTQNFDINRLCTKCGSVLLAEPSFSSTLHPSNACDFYSNSTNTVIEKESGLSITAKVFMLISTISSWLLFVYSLIVWIASLFSYRILSTLVDNKFQLLLPWLYMLLSFAVALTCLLMTISYFKRISERRPIGTAFKVCTLLFVNLLAGIFLLCEQEDGYRKKIITSTPQALPTPIVSQSKDVTEELKEYRKLLYDGVITQEHFEAKKKQILGL